MTKIDMIRAVARTTGISQANTEKTIEALLLEVQACMAGGKRVEFRGFGVWEVKIGKARVGRNPSDPDADIIHIPSRPVLRFKPSKALKAAVRRSEERKTEK